MIRLIAEMQMPVDPQVGLQWILGAAAAAVILNQGLGLWKNHFREEPRPAATYATKKEHVDLKGVVEVNHKEVLGRIDRLDLRRSDNLKGIHDKIESTSSKLRSDMYGELKAVHNRTNDILKETSELRGEVRAAMKTVFNTKR